MADRRPLAALLAGATLALAACGAGGDGFGCTRGVCTASFDGPGKQDLSSKLGAGATVEVATVDGDSSTVRISGEDAKLVKGKVQRVAGYDVSLTAIDGQDVTLRVVRP